MYETKIIDLSSAFDEGIAQGAALIKRGELCAFPTETVYGLGANALDKAAVSSIFIAKGRPGDNPLIAHVDGIEMAESIAHVTQEAELLMQAFWPGPLTIVMQKRGNVPYELTAGLQSVAVRMPANEGALALITASGVPIAAPSANLSGKPSPTTAADVYEDMNGKIPLLLDGGPCEIGVESTVLALAPVPTILRPGAITQDMLRRVIGEVALSKNILSPLREGEQVASPGMKYKHYAPKAHVTLVDGTCEQIAVLTKKLYLKAENAKKRFIILCSEQTYRFYDGQNYVIMGDRENPITMCRSLFAQLREADRNGYDEILLEALPASKQGLTYMNRAMRAAGYHIVTPASESPARE